MTSIRPTAAACIYMVWTGCSPKRQVILSGLNLHERGAAGPSNKRNFRGDLDGFASKPTDNPVAKPLEQQRFACGRPVDPGIIRFSADQRIRTITETPSSVELHPWRPHWSEDRALEQGGPSPVDPDVICQPALSLAKNVRRGHNKNRNFVTSRGAARSTTTIAVDWLSIRSSSCGEPHASSGSTNEHNSYAGAFGAASCARQYHAQHDRP